LLREDYKIKRREAFKFILDSAKLVAQATSSDMTDGTKKGKCS